MSILKNGVLILLVAGATAVAAPDDPIDPATLKDKVTIELGKKVIIQFEQKGDALSKPKVVEKAVEKAGDKPVTPTFDFSKKDDTLFPTTKNPFPKDPVSSRVGPAQGPQGLLRDQHRSGEGGPGELRALARPDRRVGAF